MFASRALGPSSVRSGNSHGPRITSHARNHRANDALRMGLLSLCYIGPWVSYLNIKGINWCVLGEERQFWRPKFKFRMSVSQIMLRLYNTIHWMEKRMSSDLARQFRATRGSKSALLQCCQIVSTTLPVFSSTGGGQLYSDILSEIVSCGLLEGRRARGREREIKFGIETALFRGSF